jgi:hypothetical protein
MFSNQAVRSWRKVRRRAAAVRVVMLLLGSASRSVR